MADSKTAVVSGQPVAVNSRGKLLDLWIIVALGVVVTCAILTACVLVTAEVYLQVALATTPTPLPTFTIAPTATPSPLPRSSATIVLPTHVPTSTPLKPTTTTRAGTTPAAKSPTSTATPIAFPTARDVTFKFDSGVSAREQNVIQRGISFAQSRLGDTGPITILAFANLDNLSTEADKYYGRSASSAGATTFREMFENGKWLANGGSGAISIWVSDRWAKLSTAYKQKTLVHEYFHNVQATLAKKGVTQTGPIWLYEGAADVVAFAAVIGTGGFTSEQIHADKVTQSRGMLSPLSSLVTLQDTQVEDTEDPYQLGYLAVEYLIAPFGDKRLDVLNQFWKEQGDGASWQEAFKSNFGLPVDDFYGRFESYRREQFPPFCGSVGVSLAKATPAPLGVRLARQLSPGDMPRTEMPWADPPNIPYVFCASGTKLPWLSTSVYRFPTRYAGWTACGANCITIFMRPTDPPGQYNFQINLPDGNQLKTSFEHKVPSSTSGSSR